MKFTVYNDETDEVTLSFNDFEEESETTQGENIEHVLKHKNSAVRFCYSPHSASQKKVDIYTHKDCKKKTFHVCGILKVSRIGQSFSMVVCMQISTTRKTIDFGSLEKESEDEGQIELLFKVSERLSAIDNDEIVQKLRDGYDDNDHANKVSVPYGANVDTRPFVYNTDEDASESFSKENTVSLAFGIMGESFDPVQTITINGTKKHPGKIIRNEAHMKNMVTVEQCVQDDSPSNSEIGKITISNPSKKRVVFLLVTHHDQDGKKATHVYGLSNKRKMEIPPAELSTATETLWGSLDTSGLMYLRQYKPVNRYTYLPMRKHGLFAQIRRTLNLSA